MEEEHKYVEMIEDPTRKSIEDTSEQQPGDISFNIVQMMAGEETKTQDHRSVR